MTNGADTAANALMTALIGSDSIAAPAVNLSDAQFVAPTDANPFGSAQKLTNADLTTGIIDGTGTFDVLMKAFGAQLKSQFDGGRISGQDYAKAYTELTTGAMANAVQYLLGRDQAYWGAVAAQMQAEAARVQVVTARIQLELAKAQLQATHYEALNNEANYALTKLKLASEDVGYATVKYNLEQTLPAQKLLLDKQLLLIQEQTNAQKAQTSDSRSDGVAVTGVLGKQKDLFNQQITSYQRDSEMKAAKLFTDAWTVMKTIDEGVLPPNGFANTSLDTILTKLKTNNGLN